MTVKYGVFYTDGGSRDKNQFAGYGFHGYIFDDQAPTSGTGLKNWFITPLGYIRKTENLNTAQRMSVWSILPELGKNPKITDVNVLEYLDGYGSIGENNSNNRAELSGVISLFEEIEASELKRCIVYIDSRYVLDGLVENKSKWVSEGVLEGDVPKVKNADLWLALFKIHDTILSHCEIILDWVKGHSGNLGNELADTLATKGTLYSKANKVTCAHEFSNPRGYWNVKVDINRMICQNRWYFNTAVEKVLISQTGHHVYHIGTHGKDDDFIGKPIAESSFSILYLKEPVKPLELIRSRQNQLDLEGYKTIVMCRLENALKATVQKDIVGSDGVLLKKDEKQNNLLSVYGDLVTKEIRPPRIAANLVDVFVTLENMLNMFIGNQLGTIRVTEITDSFFDIETKGNSIISKLKPSITSTVKSIKVVAKYNTSGEDCALPLTLTIGHDTPTRNALSALAKDTPKLFLITWPESKQAFKYATVMQVGNDFGIYCGVYSNLHLINK